MITKKEIKHSLKLAQDAEINALDRIAKSLSKVPEIEKIVFFGSRARGDFTGSSDLDVFILVTSIKIKNIVITILHDIELKYEVPLSPIIYTNREYRINKKLKSRFFENLEREGVVLYDSNHKG